MQDYGTNVTEIVLTKDIINNFLKHGEKDYPFECCGFILGHFIDEKSVGTEYIAAPNTKEENKERLLTLGGKAQVPFLVDGDTMMYESDDIIDYLNQKKESSK